MNRTGIALLSAAALLAASSASAGEMDGGSDISWTYAQIGYVQADGNDNFETDGFALDGSIALAKNWHAGARYSALSSDFSSTFNNDLDTDTWALSAGYNAGLTKNSQAYFDIGYYDTDYDYDNFDGGEGSDGFNLTAGFRYKPAPKVELGAAVTYTDGDYDDGSSSSNDFSYNDTSVALMGQYFFTPMFSVGASVGLNGGSGSFYSSSSDTFTLFLRGSFGGPMSDMSDSSDASY